MIRKSIRTIPGAYCFLILFFDKLTSKQILATSENDNSPPVTNVANVPKLLMDFGFLSQTKNNQQNKYISVCLTNKTS